jgi:hypothetical protein
MRWQTGYRIDCLGKKVDQSNSIFSGQPAKPELSEVQR